MNFKKEFQSFLKDERGQTDIIGNVIEFIKTNTVLMTVLFLGILYLSTWEFEVLGIKLGLGLIIGAIFESLFGAVGFNFNWKLFIIFVFLVALAGLALALHGPKN